jgi:hypothetical protein
MPMICFCMLNRSKNLRSAVTLRMLAASLASQGQKDRAGEAIRDLQKLNRISRFLAFGRVCKWHTKAFGRSFPTPCASLDCPNNLVAVIIDQMPIKRLVRPS